MRRGEDGQHIFASAIPSLLFLPLTESSQSPLAGPDYPNAACSFRLQSLERVYRHWCCEQQPCRPCKHTPLTATNNYFPLLDKDHRLFFALQTFTIVLPFLTATTTTTYIARTNTRQQAPASHKGKCNSGTRYELFLQQRALAVQTV
jgi:hypothetical protein